MKDNLTKWKVLNSISIFIVTITPLLMFVKVWHDLKMIDSPLIPKYTVVFLNGSKINIICFLLAGLIPAIFLRIKYQYMLSTLCLILFFSVGCLLKDSVKIYEHFYTLL